MQDISLPGGPVCGGRKCGRCLAEAGCPVRKNGIARVKDFDSAFYLADNPDVAERGAGRCRSTALETLFAHRREGKAHLRPFNRFSMRICTLTPPRPWPLAIIPACSRIFWRLARRWVTCRYRNAFIPYVPRAVGRFLPAAHRQARHRPPRRASGTHSPSDAPLR